MSGEDAVQKRTRRWRENPLTTLLGRRLLGWFLLLALFPLLAATLIGYLRSQKIVEEVMEQSLEAVTQVHVQHVRNRVDRYLVLLRAVAAGNEFLASGARVARGASSAGMGSAATRSALETYLNRQLEELQDFSDLLLLGLEGEVIASTMPFAWSEGAFGQGEEAQPVRILRRRYSADPPGLRFSVRLTGIDGENEGLLVGIVGPTRLPRLFQISEEVAGEIEGSILEDGWRPIFVSHPRGPVDYSTPLETPLRGMPFGVTSRYEDRMGVSVVGRAARIPEFSWVYLTEQRDTNAFGALRRLREASIYLALVFAVLVVGAAWLVAGGIVAPLRRLVEATRRLGAGDLNARVEPARADEIGVLSAAFNEMAGELERRALEVKELHEGEIERAAQLASVGELAAGIAHEIKNPLAGASSGIELLERQLAEDRPSENLLGQIRSELGRMDRAIRDLLSYARPKEPEVGWVSPRLLADRVVALIRPQAEAAGVVVEHRNDGVGHRVRVDPELLTQALVNLAMNGIQAMQPGGVLTLGVAERGREIHLEVSDTGRGIPEEDLENIFRPFFTTKHRGSGLGLAISRTIVERHRGRVEVETTAGLGSRFTLVLPIAEEEAAE